MANRYLSLYLYVVLFPSLYYTANVEYNITITPTDGPRSSCPQQPAVHCQTFSQFMNNSNDSSVFNTSNSTVLFLPGEHKLRNHWSKLLIVRDVSNVIWHGESVGRTVPRIHCEEDIGFMFADIFNLTIRNLEFVNCGHQLPLIPSYFILNSRLSGPGSPITFLRCERAWCIFHSDNETWASVAIANVDFVHLEYVTLKRSRGYGLIAINMLGKSSIDSCTFQDSSSQNIEARENKKLTPRNHIGGNAMIIFFGINNRYRSAMMNSDLKIHNSHFQNGSDNSEPNLTSKQLKRANGLAVITKQQQYQVHFILEKTTFTKNLGNYNHPSVLIYDLSGLQNMTNNFTVSKCNFTHDGMFRITTISSITGHGLCPCLDPSICNSDPKVHHVRSYNFPYPKRTNWVSKHITLQECNFFDGVGTGLDICTSPKHSYQDYYQRISIVDCTFQRYRATAIKKNSEESVVLVRYNSSSKYFIRKCCLNIQIEIKSCTFHNNQIPSTTFFLDRIQGYNQLGKSIRIITVADCTYSDNKTPNNSTVTMTSTTNRRIWEHEDGENNYEIGINQVIVSGTLFVNNTSNFNGIVNIPNSFVTLRNCSFSKSKGTAVRANNSLITMEGVNVFSENTGRVGGGLSLIKSRIKFMPNSTTTLFENAADYGGGIFAIPVNVTSKVVQLSNYSALCTLSLPTYNMTLLKTMNIIIKLENNTAHFAGDSIFDGAYEGCYFAREVDTPITKEKLINSLDIKWISQSELSSLPSRLCTCGRKHEQCTITNVDAFPGEIFNISLVAVGELNGITPVFVAGRTCLHDSNSSDCKHDYESEIGHGGGEQPLSRVCTNISYSVNSPRDKVALEITIRNLKEEIPLLPFDGQSTSPMSVEVNLLPCPIGFELAVKTRNERFCKCVDYLYKAGIVCNINMAKILGPNRKWVGIHSTDPYSYIVHNNCPFDYCIAGEKYIDLSVPDEQCNYKRSGVLCGACQSNMSLVLGYSKCKQCSNIYLLLILPFALAGLALVVLLLKCNLTVSTGHINAIIFYANTVQVNKAILFPTQETAYKVFTVFIAWLNLDLGIETCFYENMDDYAKIWLQFVFPVYVWILVGLMIVLANYSTRAARLTGNNSVPVLATLFILSYAKLHRTIISTISFTYIDFQDGTYVPVWLQDGNVEYFSPKHTALFIVAFLFAIGYIIPLTLLVLFAPCLQAKSHYKPLRWVNRLKPFLDAYQGPYNDKYRYWTGLMLVVRIFLFTFFASNYENDPSMNYFWIMMVVGPIGVIVLSKAKFPVYKHRFTNSLEAISLLNIVILSALNWLLSTTTYKKWPSARVYVTYISVGITALQFLVIIFYQVLLKLCPQIFTRRKKVNSDPQSVIKEMTAPAPTHSVVELSHRQSLIEPLLETEDSQ